MQKQQHIDSRLVQFCHLGNYLVWFIPIAGLLILALALVPNDTHLSLGVLALLFLAGNLLAVGLVRKSALRVSELRSENAGLLADLKQQHEQKEIAFEREEKSKLDKSRFLAAASHDLRQPLHSLRLFTATLELQTRETEHKVLVDQIDSSVQSLEELFNALLDISKLDAGTVNVEKRHVSIDALLLQIEGEFKPLAEEKNLDISVRTNGLIVNTDVSLLDTLIRNLVGNAIKYTESGGLCISTELDGERIRIAVADTGIGIAGADQLKIFEEFVQLDNSERDRSRGIGLGLCIVKRLAVLLDVQLSMESEVGNGTTFYADVPIGDKALCTPGSVKLQKPTSQLSSLFILVVDDDEDACLAIEGLLETWGCIVMCAHSGDAAIQQLREIGEVPDLVISDYRLRDGETGGEVVQRVRKELDFELPALILTGDIGSERLIDIKALNMPLLHKPCEPEALRQLIIHETSPVDEAMRRVG